MQQFNRYNGFINVYKEAGWTSMDVCAKLRHVLGVRKAGHAGTLDPMAEGVLPVAVGRATKDIDRIGGSVKEYKAVMLLGTVTDTEDITGNILSRYEGELPQEADVEAAVKSYIGGYEQLTPMYSARKVNGKKLYEYARAGIEVERKTKHVEIYDIHIDKIEPPRVTFTVQCSQGTYIRSLCRDIGEKLGCGACMEALTRNRVGSFKIEDAVRISKIEQAEQDGNVDALLSVTAPTAVAIGKFDGTHIGHQALFKELKKCAERDKLRTLVLILKFGKSGVLSDEDRKRRLYEYGIDYCIELQFTEDMRNMSAEDFLSKILIGRYNMHAIVAGKDVSFGRGKVGNAAFLEAHAAECGYTTDFIDKIAVDEDGESSEAAEINGGREIVSSTLLRKVLSEGDMEKVAELMGAPYTISGPVVHGKGIGKSKMQYPTMNIEVSDELTLPPYGVYAVRAYIYDDGARRGASYEGGARRSAKSEVRLQEIHGIANLGLRPTVDGSTEGGTRIRLEIHSFDNIGDVYGRKVRAELLKFIRPEKKFASIEELSAQISGHDVPATVAYFKEVQL